VFSCALITYGEIGSTFPLLLIDDTRFSRVGVTAEIFAAGTVASLGADCIETDMTTSDVERVAALLDRAGIAADAPRFRHYRSARRLYNFHIDHAAEY